MEKIDTIIFGGAGHRSPFYIGVIKALEELNIKKNIKNIYGSSGGALFALILTLNIDINKVAEILLLLQPNCFHYITTESVLQFDETMGLDNGIKMIQIIQELLNISGINPYITLKEYYELTNINLNLSVTNITTMKNEIFNHKTNPELFVFSAIMSSLSLPILMKPYKINNNLYIDGSVTNDLPFNCVKDLNTVLAFKHANIKEEEERLLEINNLSVYLSSILTSMLLNGVFMEKYQDNIIYIDFDCLEFLMEEFDNNNILKAIEVSYDQSIVKIKKTCAFLKEKQRKQEQKMRKSIDDKKSIGDKESIDDKKSIGDNNLSSKS